jgi:antirestriction protein ArdC
MSERIYELVTERIIAALERGTIPWHKPWHAHTGHPRSMSTGQPYRGVNVFLLALTAADEGYSSPFWGTYQQISGHGGQVRRGEHSTPVVFTSSTRSAITPARRTSKPSRARPRPGPCRCCGITGCSTQNKPITCPGGFVPSPEA